MSNKNLTILGIVAALMIVLAVAQSRIANETGQSTAGTAKLIQGLNPDDIEKITIGTGDEAVSLVRRGENFVAASKDYYPAENKAINQLITDCLDAEVGQVITSDAKNHEDLQVTESKAKTVVKFFGKEDKLMTGLIAGPNDPETGGSHVRQANSDKVYFCRSLPWMRTDAMDYMNRELLDLDNKDITEVVVRSDEKIYRILSSEGDKAALQDIPEGKKQKDAVVKQVFEALSSCNMADVSKDTNEFEFDKTYICKTKNNTVYTIKMAAKGGKYYAKLSCEFTGQQQVTKAQHKETEEELKEKEAILLAKDNAEQFNNRHTNWVYEIVDHKANNLTKKFDDLIEQVEQAKTEQDVPAATPVVGPAMAPSIPVAKPAAGPAPAAGAGQN